MKCEYCNREIPPGTGVLLEGHYFCNNLHRYEWQNRSPEEVVRSSSPVEAGVGRKKLSLTKKGMRVSIAVIVTAIFAIIGSTVGTRLAGSLFKSSQSIDNQLMQLSNEFNKSLPIMVDQVTRLDTVIPMPGKVLTYNYTLVNMSLEQIDIVSLREYLRPRIINNIKTSDEMKYLRDKGVTFVYKYYDDVKRFVFEVKVTPDEYC